jgi:hypothetical protein
MTKNTASGGKSFNLYFKAVNFQHNINLDIHGSLWQLFSCIGFECGDCKQLPGFRRANILACFLSCILATSPQADMFFGFGSNVYITVIVYKLFLINWT